MLSSDDYKGPVDVEDPAGTIPLGLEGYVPNRHSQWRFAWRRPGPHGILFALAHALAALLGRRGPPPLRSKERRRAPEGAREAPEGAAGTAARLGTGAGGARAYRTWK